MDSDGRIDPREQRIARNEALFREVNERVKEVSAEAPLDRIEFLCECGDEECTESVSLDRTEYEQLRSDPLLFAVNRGMRSLTSRMSSPETNASRRSGSTRTRAESHEKWIRAASSLRPGNLFRGRSYRGGRVQVDGCSRAVFSCYRSS